VKYLRTSTTVIRRLLAARTKLLLLDFDGTLAPICESPESVRLGKRTKESLEAMGSSDRFKIAIISGRSLSDLTSHFQISSLIYVGNHGFEIKGKGLKLPQRARSARRLETLMWHCSRKFELELASVSGVRVENKNYTLSIHYRAVSAGMLHEFNRKIESMQTKTVGWPVIWKKGKKVWEVHPYVRWGKGNMSLYLADKFSHALPIVIGDDFADEEMFDALKDRGVTVRVGSSKSSKAKYYLKSCNEVGEFLKMLHIGDSSKRWK